MQKPSELPQQIRVTQLRGLNERVSPSGLQAGEFSWLEGLYPSQTGLLSRVPGKTLLATTAGNAGILSMCQTFNTNGDIVVQTESGILAYTLDELYGRQTTPNLTPGTVPSSNDNEEAMSIAIMYHEEANGAVGGSIHGYTGTNDTGGSGSVVGTAYGRKLTSNPTNQSSTLSSFTASTGGGSSPATGGQWQLPAGTYRIRAWLMFQTVVASTGVQIALYNVTNSAVQLDDGGSAIVGLACTDLAGVAEANMTVYLNGRFVVSGSPQSFQIYQWGTPQTAIRSQNFCGRPTGVTATLVNGAAALQRYATIEILKEP